MWLWMLASAWAGECTGTVPVADVSSAADEVFLAFAAVDEEALVASTDRIFQDLPCVHENFSAADAAKVHRAIALRAFFEGRVDDAKFGLAAAFRAAPGTALSARIAPEGGKLWRLAEEASILAATPSPLSMRLRIDGAETSERVVEWPALAQLSGSPVQTAWLTPGSALPSGWASASVVADVPLVVDEPVVDEPVVAVTETTDDGWDDDWDAPKKKKEKEPKPEKVKEEKVEKVKEEKVKEEKVTKADVDEDEYDLGNTKVKKEKSGKKKSATGLWVGTSVTAVAAAGLFGTSAYMRGQFDEDPTKAKYDMTNGTFYGSMGAAGLTVLLGGFAIAGSF